MERITRYKKLSKEMKGSLITLYQLGVPIAEIAGQLNVNVSGTQIMLIFPKILIFFFSTFAIDGYRSRRQ